MSFARHRLFWPAAILVILLVSNVFFASRFLSVTVHDGHLYGSLIDILRNSAPLILVGIGMTMVIATGGIDLSVGSVMAISGALACLLINDGHGLFVALIAALVLCLLLGVWNGMLVAGLGIQPIIATLILMVAGRGVAQLLTDGQILNVSSPSYKVIGAGYALAVPVSVLIAAAVVALRCGPDPPYCAGSADRGGRGQPYGLSARRDPGQATDDHGVRVRGRLCGHRRDHLQLERGQRGQQRGRQPDRAGRDPGYRYRWYGADRGPVLAGRDRAGGGTDPDVERHDDHDRHPGRDDIAVQGDRGDRLVSGAVAGVPGQGFARFWLSAGLLWFFWGAACIFILGGLGGFFWDGGFFWTAASSGTSASSGAGAA